MKEITVGDKNYLIIPGLKKLVVVLQVKVVCGKPELHIKTNQSWAIIDLPPGRYTVVGQYYNPRYTLHFKVRQEIKDHHTLYANDIVLRKH